MEKYVENMIEIWDLCLFHVSIWSSSLRFRLSVERKFVWRLIHVLQVCFYWNFFEIFDFFLYFPLSFFSLCKNWKCA